MDIKVKLEPVELPHSPEPESQIKVEIKHEKELLIEEENQWLPIKLEDEENDYYQDFVADNGQDGYFEAANDNETAYEHYTIEYIDESQDYDGNDDDEEVNDDNNYDEEESDGNEVNISDEGVDSMDIEYNLDLNKYNYKQLEVNESTNKEKTLSSAFQKIDFCKYTFNEWLLRFYIKRECPGCKKLFAYHIEWQQHILNAHEDLIKESDTNYVINDNRKICKICNRHLVSKIICYLHSLRHTENGNKLDTNICKLCNFESNKNPIILQHFLEKHTDVVDKFKKSDAVKKIFICPICDNNYNKYLHMTYHLRDKHPEVYYSKFRYICHLCKLEDFKNEEVYLQHLMEEHELNFWKSLNYRQIFDDKEYFACLECHRVFIENNAVKLLKHFLQHDNTFYWICKFCCRKIAFKKSNYNHVCKKMVRYYVKQRKEAKQLKKEPVNTALESQEKKQQLQNLQEFEEYIFHICPFCKKEFGKMIKWQQHLRNRHAIDTLKGLEMKVTANHNNKLCCVICHTMVANCPEQLHAHRFQHLPYHPYKCRHCAQTLSTFKMALNHVIKRCNDEGDRDFIKNLIARKCNGEARTHLRLSVCPECPFCNYQKFDNTPILMKHLEDEHNNFEDFFVIHADNSRTCKVCYKCYLKYDKKTCFEHINLHFDEKFFKCPMCNYTYTSFKTCNHHLACNHYAKPLNQMKTKEKVPASLNEENIVEINNGPLCLARSSLKSHVLNEFVEFITFACPECNEGLSKQEDWHSHITTKHNFFDKSNMYFKDSDGSLKCTTCKMKLVTSTTQQQKHKLTHMPYRSFICSLCYIRCNSLGILYSHLRRKHFASGSFKCPTCSEILSTEYLRSEHIKKQHPRQEWPRNMCLICYRILATKTGLNVHMTTHDVDRFKYTCEICGSRVLDVKDFNLHLARHKERGETKKHEEINENDLILQSSSKNSKESITDDIKQEEELYKEENDKVVSKTEEKTVSNKRKSHVDSPSMKNNKINKK